MRADAVDQMQVDHRRRAIDRELGVGARVGRGMERAVVLHEGELTAVELAEALVRARARDAQLAHQLVASRSELTRLVTALMAGAIFTARRPTLFDVQVMLFLGGIGVWCVVLAVRRNGSDREGESP